MAVYTDIRDDELIEFLKNYDIGSLHSFKGIAEGVENSNFFVSTERGNFILTLYEKRVEERDLPFFLGLMEHLSAKGFRCPQPIARLDGQLMGRLAGRPAAIISFLDGISVRRPSVAQCRQVGSSMARMHQAAEGFEIERKNALGPLGCRPLLEQSRERADEVEAGLWDLIESELSFLQSQWPAELPSGVIHADLFPDNVFFLDGDLSGVIDFYFACNDLLAYDIAVCLNAWCFESDFSFNTTKAAALLNGYVAIRPLAAAETAALPVLCRGAAIRFLATRLHDWLNIPAGALVTPKDPGEYIAKLRFHRGVSSAGEYGLT